MTLRGYMRAIAEIEAHEGEQRPSDSSQRAIGKIATP
jgi:hypothetical protein